MRKYQWKKENRKGRNGVDRQAGSLSEPESEECSDSGGYYCITGLSELKLLTALLESGALWAVCVSAAIAGGYDRHHSGRPWLTASAAKAWLSHTAEQWHQGLKTHTLNSPSEAMPGYSVCTLRKGMKKPLPNATPIYLRSILVFTVLSLSYLSFNWIHIRFLLGILCVAEKTVGDDVKR